MFDYVQAAIGEVLKETLHVHTQLQRPDVRIRDPAQDNAIVDTVRSDVPDLLSLHGTLAGSATVTGGATVTAYYRRGQPSFGDASFTWSLTCERGEIRLVAPEGANLQANAYKQPVTIQVQHYDKDGTVEEVPWAWSDGQGELPAPARSVMTQYEAFAAGDVTRVVSIESALSRAKQVEQLMAGKGESNPGWAGAIS